MQTLKKKMIHILDESMPQFLTLTPRNSVIQELLNILKTHRSNRGSFTSEIFEKEAKVRKRSKGTMHFW